MSLLSKGFFSLLGFGSVLQLAAQPAANRTAVAFRISGSMGASANFYSSNETIKTRPTFAWNTYGNLVAQKGKWTIPLYFVINQFSKSNASPYVQIGVSPTYQWARLHLGYRFIPFSPLTFEGQTFRGAGVELYPRNFRFAAFYGRLNKAVNEDTSSGRFRVPQFSRTGYGIKAGFGNATRFIDIIYFHAKDDSTSATLLPGSSATSLRAQENAVLGTSFKLTLKKRWIWTGDAAVSGLVQDLSGKQGADSSNKGLRDFIGKFLPGGAAVSADFAAQSSLAFYSGNYNGNLSYRRVQPGFKSLGTPYMLDDVELVSLVSNFSAVQRKVNIHTNLTQQHNNLDKNLEAELRTRVGNLNVNTIFGQHLNVNLHVAGYGLKQRNDRNNLPDSLRLNDTLLLNQQILQYGISPSYNLTKGNLIHFITGNLTLQKLDDKNRSTASQTNSTNLSTTLTYTLAFIPKAVSFSLTYLHSRYKQTANDYTSNGGTLGASAQLLKSRRLNIQGSVGYYHNRFNNTNTQKNTSYSLNTAYRGRHHAFSAFAHYIYTPPNNAINEAINRTIPYAVANRNLYGGVSYHYTF